MTRATRPDGEKPVVKEMVVRLPHDLHQQVRERAEEEDRTMSQTIRVALKQYLKSNPAV